MKQLSIQLIERYSGIKAHTIRMWEHRHGLFNPQRSAGNRRYYHIEDFSLILDLAILTKYGYSISRVSKLSAIERKLKIQQLERTPAAGDIHLNKLILHFLDTDIISFEHVFNEFLKIKNINVAITELIVPFLERVQLLSYADQSPSTHFAVTTIRKKLIGAIELTAGVPRHQKTILLFLPKGQHYDLILLYLAYRLQSKGFRVLYLGTNISMHNLSEVSAVHHTDAWVTYLPPGDKTDIKTLREFASEYVDDGNLLIATATSTPSVQKPETGILHYNEITARLSDVFQLY